MESMTTNEQRVLSIIWDWGGEASVDIISREAGISIDYAKLLGESLKKEGCIDFLHSKLCKIKSKGKVLVAEKKGQSRRSVFDTLGDRNPRRIVVPEKPSKFGLGKDKRGRFILNYG